MPFLAAIPAIIPALIGAAATTAVSIDSIVNQPSSPAAPVAPKAIPLTSAQQSQAVTADTSQASDILAQTGGAASPDYITSILNASSNNPQLSGATQQAINQFFGFAAPGQTGLTPGGSGGAGASPTAGSPTNSITDLIAKATQGGGGAGGGGSPLINSSISDSFRGFA